jgi:hypothetical protein
MAHQAQMRRGQHRLQQRMRRQLGDAVGQPDRQPHHLATGRLAHLVGMHWPSWKISSARAKAAWPGLGERHAAACRLEQLVAERPSPARAPAR